MNRYGNVANTVGPVKFSDCTEPEPLLDWDAVVNNDPLLGSRARDEQVILYVAFRSYNQMRESAEPVLNDDMSRTIGQITVWLLVV